MKKLLFTLVLAGLTGCAYLSSVTTEKVSSDGRATNVVTTVHVYTLFDSSSELAKMKNSGKGTSISGLDQESSTSNLVNFVTSLASLYTGRGAAVGTTPAPQPIIQYIVVTNGTVPMPVGPTNAVPSPAAAPTNAVPATPGQAVAEGLTATTTNAAAGVK